MERFAFRYETKFDGESADVEVEVATAYGRDNVPTLEFVVGQFEQFLLAVGYHPELIKQLIVSAR